MTNERRQVEISYVAKIDRPSYQRLARDIEKQNIAQLQSARSLIAEQAKQTDKIKDTVKVSRDIVKVKKDELKAAKLTNEEDKDALSIARQRLKLQDDLNTKRRNTSGSLGDVDSSAIQTGSALRTLGIDIPVIENVAAVAELAEGVANLQAAVPASIESLKVLTNEVGIETVAGLGAAGIALAGFAAVLTLASNESAKAEKAMESQLNAQRLYYQAIEGGDLEATTGDLASVQSELRAEMANLAEIERRVNRQFGESNNVLQDAGSRIRFFTSELGVNDGRLKELIEQQKASNDTITELRDKENALLRARDNLSVATETLEQAEARRAEASKERASSFIQYADDIRNLREFELSTLQSSTDANEKLLFQLQKNTDFAREQIEIAKSSGENNEITADAIARYNKEIEQNAAKIEILTAVSLPYTKQLDAQAEATKQAEEASKALDKSERERAAKQEAISRQRTASLGKLVQLETQASEKIEDFARTQAESIANRNLEAQRATEDYNNQTQKLESSHQQKLTDIRTQGKQQVANIEQRINSDRQSFFDTEIESQRQYQRDLKKLNRQYYIEDKQDLQNHLFDLRNFEQNNDVAGFLAAQRAQELEKKQKQDNRSEEFRQLNEQAAEEKRLRQEAFRQRQTELQRELDLQKQQTQERIATEQQAFRQAQAERAQERRLELARQAEDNRIADQRAQQALQRELQAIEVKARAELTAIQQVTSATGQLEAVARRIASIASSAGSGSNSSRSISSSTGLGLKSYERNRVSISRTTAGVSGSSKLLTAFAKGGIVPGAKPQLAMVGDTPSGIDEAIVPFRRSKGLPAALRDYGLSGRSGGGNNINISIPFNPTMNVGELVSPSEMTQVLQEFATDLERQLYQGISRAVNMTG